MANEELIDEYIDQAAFKAQTDFAVNEVNRLIGTFDSLKKAKAEISSAKGLTDMSAAVRQSEKDTQLLLKTQQQLAITKRAEILLDNEILKNAALKEKAADRIIKKEQEIARAKAANAQPEFAVKTGGEDDVANLKKTGEAVNDLDRAQAQAAISATEFGNSQNKSTRAVKEVNTEAQKTVLTARQLALAKAEGKLITERETAALKLQVREEIAVKGSLEQRRAALIRLNQVYDNQSPQERASAAGQRLQKIIQGLDAQVKTLEATTGRAQRNVGNYGSAFNAVSAGASKAFGVLRNLAYLIPGIGIGGLIAAISDPIVSLTKNLLGFGEVSEKVKNQQAEIATAFKTAADGIADEISKVTLLKAVLESDTATRLQKVEALKQLKELNVDYFGQLDIEDGKVKGLTLAYDGYISRLIRSINAKANVEQLTQALKEQANVIGTINKDLSQVEGKFTANNLTQFQIFDAIRRFNLTFGAEKDQSTFIGLDQLQLIADLLNAEARVRAVADKIKSDVSDIFDPKKGAESKKANAENLQALKELLDNTFKLYEIAQKRKIGNFERDLSSDKVHYLDKIIILEQFYKASKELIDRQEQEEIRLARDKAAREIQKLQEEKSGKSSAEQARINENIKTVQKNLEQELLVIKAQAADKSTVLAQTTSDKKVKIDEDYLKIKKDFLDQEAEYEKLTVDKIEALRKSRLATIKEFEAKELELFKELQNKKVEAALAAEKFLFSLGDATYQRQLNNIKKQQEEVDKQKEAELAANDARVQSEQDKAANIIIINTRAQTEKDKLDRKAKEIELQRARFDRAQQAFEISINTIKAIAEIKAKAAVLAASGNPLIAALAIKALAQIPLVLATSAAALGALFAMPLPRLFRGKKKGVSVGEAAILNDHPDGVTTEVIERANGSIEFPEGRNVIRNIGVNDIVHPDKDAWLNAILNAAHRDASAGMRQPAKRGDNQLAAALYQQTKILREIARKPSSTTHATDRGLVQVMHWGATQIKYVNENTNW